MLMLSAALIMALLAFAGWRDIATRLIPDEAVIGVALLGAALRAAEGLVPLLASAGAAAILFLLLALLCARGLLGGGDVKVAAAVALGLSPAALPGFIVVTTMAGGVLGLGYLLAARLAPPPRRLTAGAPVLHRVLAAECRRIHRGGPLPYGVAIAFGGGLVLLKTYGG
ncbi:prepilin peptidase [Falsiroseomonas sp.]|uniref:prepilin peptidase n=1 Tax=Falsiroseomonas sp. TaxID=2870721 RepID=UPI003561EAD8